MVKQSPKDADQTKYELTKEANFKIILFKKWLKDNDIEMYSIRNEGKSVVAEKFIKALKTKIYKYMTSVSKNVYIDKLDDMVNEYNNTYHRTIKMRPVDVKDNAYIDSIDLHANDKDPKVKVGDHVRISKYENIFAKKFLQLKKLKIQFHGHMLLMTLMVKKLLEYFMKKNYK